MPRSIILPCASNSKKPAYENWFSCYCIIFTLSPAPEANLLRKLPVQ